MLKTGNSDCIFCAIIRGAAEASRVYEDAQTLAIMNIRQANPGHVLVLPKRHIERIELLDSITTAALFQTVVKMSRAINEALHPDGLNIWQSNGTSAGQEIPHIHVHLFPRTTGDRKIQFYTELPPQAERPYLNELAAQIRSALP